MTGDSEPFGEAAARKIAQDLDLDENWFNYTLPTPKEAANTSRQADHSTTERCLPKFLDTISDISTGTDHQVAEFESPSYLRNDDSSEDGSSIVINQYDVGGGMGNSRLLLSEQPGVIRKWEVDRKWVDANVPNYTSIANLSIVTGFGPSMRPMFNPGDPLLVDRGVRSVTHDGIYFFRIGDEGYIKIIQRVPSFDGSQMIFRVISKNTDYPPFDISPKAADFEILALVLTVWKSDHC
ncbi:MAG: helix-turn-helix transcriptional regulator [Comamonas sp.]|nr:helix-turn-helix transcriptional regulator [Comamonas sp.]